MHEKHDDCSPQKVALALQPPFKGPLEHANPTDRGQAAVEHCDAVAGVHANSQVVTSQQLLHWFACDGQ